MASVSLRNIEKVYSGGVRAVRDFDLEIPDKEFVVLVGPSGCGKSTVLRMIAGLEEVSGGDLYIGDRLVNKVPARDRDIAMVFQNYALYPYMTVYKNMSFGLTLRKTPFEIIEERIDESARMLSLEELLERYPNAMSGGQRQRVALGRSVVREPEVFLLDEPLSNLDSKLRVAMRTEIIRMHKRLETTFIYVTHDQTEAMTMGSRIVVMKDGIMQQAAAPQTLYDNPANMFVAGFIGMPQMNFIEAELVKERGLVVKFSGIKIPVPPAVRARIKHESFIGKPVVLGIRPEDIKLDNAGKGTPLECTADFVENLGNELLIYLNVTGYEKQLVTRVYGRCGISAGDKMRVKISADYMHLFDPATERTILNPKR